MAGTVTEFQTGGKVGEDFGPAAETNPSVAHIAKAAARAGPADLKGCAMSLAERIPTLTDEQVVNLLDNARRLSAEAATPRQAAAAELLPVLEAAAAERREARLAAAQVKRAAARGSRTAAV